ncbi:MAG: hypothetical protein JWN48_1235, partial [Myxococcaceae bacterium]|nr:hypothetical protein [Myxococcaceae bacterium]
GAVGVLISQAPRKVEQDSVEVRTTRALVRPAERDEHSGSVNPASSTGATAEPVAAEPEPREPERNRVTAVAELQQPRAQALAATPAVEDSSALASAGSERAPGARKVATDGSERKHGARVGGRRGASHRHSSFRARAHRERPSAPSSAHSQSAEPQPMLAVAPLAAASAEAPPAAPVPLEVELIRKAMTSLRDHDAGRALALLEEHAARYPSGAFATERRGLHAVALCAAGRVSEGKSEQASFLRTDSAAPIAARVRRACGEPIE